MGGGALIELGEQAASRVVEASTVIRLINLLNFAFLIEPPPPSCLRQRLLQRALRVAGAEQAQERARSYVRRASGNSSGARRNSCALTATMIVLSDISTAPMAGLRTTPLYAIAPAASGMATML